jgi:hypothetical protein
MGRLLRVLLGITFFFILAIPAVPSEGQPDGVVHPIIGYLRLEQDNPSRFDFTVIGASADEKWFEEEFPFNSVVSPESYIYDFYSMDGYLGNSIDGFTYLSLNDCLQHSLTLNFEPELDTDGKVYRVFGISADWDPLPRKPVMIDPDQEWLYEAVKRALEVAKPMVEEDLRGIIGAGFDGYLGDEFNYHDITTDPVAIEEALSVDLDGDGDQEVIVSARVGEKDSRGYDSRRFPVLINGSDDIPLNTHDLGTLIILNMDEMSPVVDYILDGNGDGLMEIVIEYGCCLSSDCDFITLLPDGTIEKHTFGTDRWDW